MRFVYYFLLPISMNQGTRGTRNANAEAEQRHAERRGVCSMGNSGASRPVRVSTATTYDVSVAVPVEDTDTGTLGDTGASSAADPGRGGLVLRCAKVGPHAAAEHVLKAEVGSEQACVELSRALAASCADLGLPQPTRRLAVEAAQIVGEVTLSDVPSLSVGVPTPIPAGPPGKGPGGGGGQDAQVHQADVVVGAGGGIDASATTPSKAEHSGVPRTLEADVVATTTTTTTTDLPSVTMVQISAATAFANAFFVASQEPTTATRLVTQLTHISIHSIRLPTPDLFNLLKHIVGLPEVRDVELWNLGVHDQLALTFTTALAKKWRVAAGRGEEGDSRGRRLNLWDNPITGTAKARIEATFVRFPVPVVVEL